MIYLSRPNEITLLFPPPLLPSISLRPLAEKWREGRGGLVFLLSFPPRPRSFARRNHQPKAHRLFYFVGVWFLLAVSFHGFALFGKRKETKDLGPRWVWGFHLLMGCFLSSGFRIRLMPLRQRKGSPSIKPQTMPQNLVSFPSKFWGFGR